MGWMRQNGVALAAVGISVMSSIVGTQASSANVEYRVGKVETSLSTVSLLQTQETLHSRVVEAELASAFHANAKTNALLTDAIKILTGEFATIKTDVAINQQRIITLEKP